MADNKVLIELQVVQKGDSLSIIQKDTDKLAKTQDKLDKNQKKVGKSSETVIKGQKGIHQANLSSSKGFSKMNQMLSGGGGSSSLVAAYATLAANVFAATAAFNAFRSAAAFEQLTEGFTFMANQAGRTMDLVVDKLKEVAGGALSTEQALQGASLAISAGFSTDDLEKLTKVAKGASLALGRNMSDAFDRLTRGAIKLEPEILDELGIMVRLDDATEAYAATIGKTANELTQFQRQTAFINAINEQGIEKYGELADAVGVNPYDKLAAAFTDLTKAGLTVLNKVLIPFANIFAGSSSAMIGGLVLFASTIITTMIPALGNMAKNSSDAADQALRLADAETAAVDNSLSAAKADLGIGKKRTKTVKDLQRVVKEGGDVQKQALITEKNLKKQLSTQESIRDSKLKKVTATQKTAAKARIVDIEREIAATKVLANADSTRLGQAVVAETARTAATQARIVSDATGQISQAGVVAGFKIATVALQEYIATQVVATTTTGFFAGAQAFLARAFGISTVAIRLYGTALLTAVPILAGIAIAIGVVMTVVGAMGDRFRKEVAGMEILGKVTEELDNKFKQLNTTIGNLGANASEGNIRIRQIKQSAGIFLEVAQGITEIERAAQAANTARQNAIAGNDFGARKVARLAGNPFALEDFDNAEGKAAGDKVVKQSFGSLKTSLQGIAGDTSEASELLRDQLEKEFESAFGEEYTSKGGLTAFIAALKPKDFDNVSTAVGKAASNTKVWDQGLTNLKRSLSEGEQDFSKFFAGASQKTEYDGIVKQFNTLKTSIKELGGGDTKEGLKELFEKAGAQLKKFRKEGESTEDFMKRIGAEGGLASSFEEIQKQTRTLQTDLKQLNVEAKALKFGAGLTSGGTEDLLKKQREIFQIQIDLNQAIIDEIDLEGASEEIKQRIVKLGTENAALELQKKTDTEITQAGLITELKVKQKLLGLEQGIASSRRTERANEAKVRKLMTGGSSTLSPIKENTLRIEAAREEFAFAKRKAKLEQEMIIAKFALFALEQKSLLDQKKITEESYNAALIAAGKIAGLQIEGAMAQSETAESTKKLAIAQGLASGNLMAMAQSFNELTKEGEKMAGVGVLVAAAFNPMIESLKALGTDESGALANAIEKFQTLAVTLSEMKETIRELTEVLDTLGGNKDIMPGLSNEKLATGLVRMQAIGQVISAVGALAMANSKMQVAAIDRQIEAEKRVDGNSKSSLAKIDAMEKKKTAIRRKAFEEDKKIKIAQAMIAGITGAVMAYASLAWIPFVGPALGAAVAAAIMGLTAKSISMIQSSQFDGGGATGGGTPQSISIGSRSNSVDVANAVTGGEQSYLRGDKGVGSNANSFAPGGAAGMRNGYAAGGEVLVGEQGPEVMQVPTSGFNITPGDARGGTTNANFTINAVDAAGVEEVLTAQRANIINMIREAAHEHGEEFIEGVNTSSYGGG